MSSTSFGATATCQASLNFSLNDYLKSLADKIVANFDDYEEGIRYDLEDCDVNEVVEKFNKYISSSQYSQVNEINITMDSEEDNGYGDIFDLLVKSIREDVMTSKVMEIYSMSYDSREGMSAYHYYITKSGREIGSDRILELIENSEFVD